MTCPMCGCSFEEKDGQPACQGCGMFGKCGLVRCPNCGYEIAPEPQWFKRLKERRKAHGN